LKHDKYNKKAKLYEFISKEIMDIYIKEMLNEILAKYDDVVFKGSYDIGNCKLVKYDIKLNNERPIKYKQSLRLTKKNKWIKK